MKAVFALFILTAAAWGADAPAGQEAASPVKAEAAPPTMTPLTDAVQVFQKAFWKRPAKSDVIRHAERQEWKDDTGIRKWAWFIIVKPSPELRKRLRDDNAFNLVAVPSAQPVKDAPQWFALPSGETEVLRAPQGGMQLVFDRKDGLLYASDSGGGFEPGRVVESKAGPAAPAVDRRPFKLPPEK